MTRKLTCIVCPMGCPLTVELEGKKVLSVAGNTCPRGEKYAVSECTAPTRVLTTTVRVAGGTEPLVSVKTTAAIPKELLFEAMEVLNSLTVKAPVALGDILAENLCGTGVSVAAGKSVASQK